jgi:hypothetical protein
LEGSARGGRREIEQSAAEKVVEASLTLSNCLISPDKILKLTAGVYGLTVPQDSQAGDSTLLLQ